MSEIGHNRSPEERAVDDVETLAEEAQHWLDGEPVTTQAMADKIGELMSRLRLAEKTADALRVREKKPYDDAAKAVQAKWKPVLEKASRAVEVCKQALSPFLKAEAQRLRDEQAAAHAKSEALHQEARAAFAEAKGGDLAAREAAEAKAREADRAGRESARLEGVKPQAGSDFGRVIHLRKRKVVTVVNAAALAKHLWMTNRQEYDQFLQETAERYARLGLVLPGVKVEEVEGVA
jgi:hypothetical protein